MMYDPYFKTFMSEMRHITFKKGWNWQKKNFKIHSGQNKKNLIMMAVNIETVVSQQSVQRNDLV